MSTTAARISPASGTPHEHALRIAETATEAWYSAHDNGDPAIPLSVLGALALINPPQGARHSVGAELIKLGADEFADSIRRIWTVFVRTRPDLLNPVYPLLEPWFDHDRPMSPENLRAAKHVADRVLGIDLLGLTGTENRYDVDLLGLVLTLLRPKSALQGRGQYYTPSDVADILSRLSGPALMADLTSDDTSAGSEIHDPACGTGGLLRATAESLRRRGANPADYEWYGNDVDALAIAGFAVNAVLWGLGYKVVLGVADSLTEPDWTRQAMRMRQETIDLAHNAQRSTRVLAAVRGLERLLADDVPDTDTPRARHDG